MAKKITKAMATTHISGWTSPIRPLTALRKTQVTKPAAMPVVMVKVSGMTIIVTRTGNISSTSPHSKSLRDREHQEADHHQRRRRRLGRHDAGDRRDEDGQQEQHADDDRGQAGPAAL
jgi:hypothetical protein